MSDLMFDDTIIIEVPVEPELPLNEILIPGPQGPPGSSGGGSVSSVAGRTGAVTLTKSDVGLNNVDNTSDVDKPVSNATAEELQALSDALSVMDAGPVFRVDTLIAFPASAAFLADLALLAPDGGRVVVPEFDPGDPLPEGRGLYRLTDGVFVFEADLFADFPDTTMYHTRLVDVTQVVPSEDLATIHAGGLYRVVFAAMEPATGAQVVQYAGNGALAGTETVSDALDFLGGNAVILEDGYVPVSVLPPVAITTPMIAANEAAMLALTAQIGDLAFRSDETKVYVLAAEPATTVGNWWQWYSLGENTVSSVAGRVGAVTLTKSDVGLNNVDNTSDLNKPVSTAVQTALDLKATTSALTKSSVGLSNVDNTTDANKPISTATQTALDLKASSTDARLLNHLEPMDGPVGAWRSMPFPGPHNTGPISTTTANSALTIQATPMWVGRTTSFDRIGIYLSTPATDVGAVIEMGWCPSGADGGPDLTGLIVAGQIPVAGVAAGLKELTIAPTLSRGMYWLLVTLVTSTTAGTNPVFYVNTGNPSMLNQITMDNNNAVTRWIASKPTATAGLTGYSTVATTFLLTTYFRAGMRVAGY